MLQRVALGQVRFNVPGLTADSRGIVTGRHMVLRFSALERLVSFLRLWSGEQALDDFQPGLRLVQVRTPGGTREALVVLPVTSLPLVDAAARAARTAGGQCFTGAGKHFVQYRDARAPLGYDVLGLDAVDESTDFVLYSQDHTQAYAVMGDLPLDKLLLRLELQRQHGDQPVRRETLFLTVRRGLGALVIAYLFRAERQNPALRVSAALCEPPVEGTFQRGPAFWIFRLENVPVRLLGVLSRTPGMRLLVPVADNVAVELGYRHPVHLGSCRQVFPLDQLFLFGPAPAGVTIINPAPVFSPVADLVRLQAPANSPLASPPGTAHSTVPQWTTAPSFGAPPAPEDRGPGAAAGRPATEGRFGDAGQSPSAPQLPTPTLARPQRRPELVVPLRLEAAPVGVTRAVATLVPWERVGWIRALCYALPPPAVRGYRVAFLQRGVLVIAADALDAFPFGLLLHAPATGLLIPLGMELRPAISPHELGSRLGASGGALVVFPGPDQPPFRVPADALVTLEAIALADPALTGLAVEELDSGRADREEPPEIRIENQPLGPMPLWRLGQ